MPLPRIMTTAFAGASVVAVLCSLIGFGGWLPDAALVLALLLAAAYVVRNVGRPVARRALAAGIVALAAVPVVEWFLIDDLSALVTRDDVSRLYEQRADADHVGALFLLVAAAALTVGVAALPQVRRARWLTALACVAALVPVAVVVRDAADGPDFFVTDATPAALWWHLAPGLAATVFAGLTLVLAMSRADRWFLLAGGALLVQVTVADWTWSSSGAWTVAQLFGGAGRAEVSSAFLEPGLRTEVPATATPAVDVDLGAALMTAVSLLGPALIAFGAAHRRRADPEQPQEA